MSGNLTDPTSSKKMKVNFLVAGLNGSGKTTLSLKTSGRLHLLHVLGLSSGAVTCNEVEYNNAIYKLWETGGENGSISFLPLNQMHGLIYVVDSSIRTNIELAKHYLMTLFQNIFDNLPLQVLANKQDLPDVMTAEEITDKLGLRGLENCRWNIKETVAINEAGRYDALEWLSTQIQRKNMN